MQRTIPAETPPFDSETPRADCRALRTELPNTSARPLQTTVDAFPPDFRTTTEAFRSARPAGVSNTMGTTLHAATLVGGKFQRAKKILRNFQRILHGNSRR